MKRLKRKLGDVRRLAYKSAGLDPITGLKIYPYPTEKLGSEYGGWQVPLDQLTEGAVCYCVGAGEDITFDLALLERGCDVYTNDPTPRAIAYVESIGEVKFLPFGVWSSNITQRFYAPKNPEHVSHSIVNLQKTDADCKTVKEIMRLNGHERLALLKIDIEGAEYEVIKSVMADKIPVTVLCIEFDEIHTALDGGRRKRIQDAARMIVDSGYKLISVDVSNYTFLKVS